MLISEARLRPSRRNRRKVHTMKIKTFALSVGLFGTALAASAGSSWSVSIGFGGPAYYPAPYYPAPVMVAPAYCPPPPVYYAPPPVVYCPPRPVYAPHRFVPPGYAWGPYPQGRGYDRYDRHDHRSGHGDRSSHQRDWQAGRR